MKLPWDKKYLRIALHAVFAVVVSYILIVAVNFCVYMLSNMGDMAGTVSSVLSRFMSVFSVLIMSFVIAYLLDPAADFFQHLYKRLIEEHLLVRLERNPSYREWRKKHPPKKPKTRKRTAGTLTVYLIIIALLSVIGLFLTKSIGGTAKTIAGEDFATALTQWIEQSGSQLNEFYIDVTTRLMNWGVADYVSDFISSAVGGFTSSLSNLSRNAVGIVTATGGVIMNLFLSFVVAFYFLQDKEGIKNATNEAVRIILPERIGRLVKTIFGEIHAVFSGYIRGQLTDGLIMAVLVSTVLSLIGVRFAVIIGIITGFSNLIPYFGAIVGFVLSVSVALLSGEPTKALYAGIAVMVLQQIDGMFIVPRVVGQKVELSPALVLLSLAVFGNLFGFVGLLFAVPICAIIKIFVLRLYNRRKFKVTHTEPPTPPTE